MQWEQAQRGTGALSLPSTAGNVAMHHSPAMALPGCPPRPILAAFVCIASMPGVSWTLTRVPTSILRYMGHRCECDARTEHATSVRSLRRCRVFEHPRDTFIDKLFLYTVGLICELVVAVLMSSIRRQSRLRTERRRAAAYLEWYEYFIVCL